jgi:hypothetical protein
MPRVRVVNIPPPPSSSNLSKKKSIPTVPYHTDTHPRGLFPNLDHHVMEQTAFVIPYRKDCNARKQNLESVVSFARSNLGPNIDIAIVHQAANPIENHSTLLRHARIIELVNPGEFDRAWALNVYAKMHPERKYIIFGDADIPLQDNVPSLLTMLQNEWVDFISPYSQIASLDAPSTKLYKKCKGDVLSAESIRNQYTFSGGVLLMRSAALKDVNYMYEVSHYGYEDRFFDVWLEHLGRPVWVDGKTYVHFKHPSSSAGARTRALIAKTRETIAKPLYRCNEVHLLYQGTNWCHACSHNITDAVERIHNAQVKGDPNKYTQ